MSDEEWQIPPRLQPDAGRYSFDLDNVLRSVVGIKTHIPEDAFTASALGTQRAGSGALLKDSGLIVTAGYLVAEAESVWLGLPDGGVLAGDVVGYDHSSGLGLVQPLGRLDLTPLEIGDFLALGDGEPVLLAAAGGRQHAIEARVVAREPFAGYWEYALDKAIFTAPAHPFWGGAALIGANGTLLGVGSLVVQNQTPAGQKLDLNMVVPIDLLPGALDNVLKGGASELERPWVGIFCSEVDGAVTVQGVASDGPADSAGLQAGDRIQSVNGIEPVTLSDLWRTIWESGPVGSDLAIMVLRGRRFLEVTVRTAQRVPFIRSAQLH